MKKVIFGGEKSYLIEREEAEQKIRKELELNDGKIFLGISYNFGPFVEINYCDPEEIKVEKHKKYTTTKVTDNIMAGRKNILVKIEDFLRIFKIKEEIKDIDDRYKSDENYTYASSNELLIDKKNCYLLLKIGKTESYNYSIDTIHEIE